MHEGAGQKHRKSSGKDAGPEDSALTDQSLFRTQGGARGPWLEAREWKRIQHLLPIACVDVMPTRVSIDAPPRLRSVGLIRRSTPHQGDKWCLLGGRVFYGESLGDALTHTLHETLGEELQFTVDVDQQPLYVAQYFPAKTRDFGHDPRQHAVGLTFAVEISGSPKARGEALGFEWFAPDSLPPPQEFGFEQEKVVASCISSLERRNW